MPKTGGDPCNPRQSTGGVSAGGNALETSSPPPMALLDELADQPTISTLDALAADPDFSFLLLDALAVLAVAEDQQLLLLLDLRGIGLEDPCEPIEPPSSRMEHTSLVRLVRLFQRKGSALVRVLVRTGSHWFASGIPGQGGEPLAAIPPPSPVKRGWGLSLGF